MTNKVYGNSCRIFTRNKSQMIMSIAYLPQAEHVVGAVTVHNFLSVFQ